MGFLNKFLKVGLVFIGLTLTLVIFLCIRSVLFSFLEESPCFDDHDISHFGDYDGLEPYVNETLAIERFRNGLKFETVCRKAGDYNRKELHSMVAFIEKSYPGIHSSPLVQMEIISNYSMLYKVEGRHASLLPYLLLAHLDVVPTENQNWQHHPFSADVEDGFIYARGALDIKHNLFGILESLELLLTNGYKPERTFYISFGHDEECSGFDGAREVAEVLRKRKVHFEFVLDEGTMVITDMFVSVNKPVALVAVSEKGYLTLQLSVNYTGGHSSMPEKESSIGILSKAVVKLNSEAHTSMLGYGIEKFMLEAISYHDNVIPTYVEAIINHRIHSSQTVSEVVDYDRKLINDDRVKLKVLRSFEPVRPSCFLSSCIGYQVIKETVRTFWKDVVVVPVDMIANTDSRFYASLADNIYRFSPLQLKPNDLKMIHGEDERISIDGFLMMIKFYHQFILTIDKYHIHGAKNSHQEL